MRLVLPAIGNNFMGLIKETSLTFTLGLAELMARSQSEAALTFRYMEQYLAVELVHWVMIILTEIIQYFSEKKLSLAYS